MANVNVSYDRLDHVAKVLKDGESEIGRALENLRKQVDELVHDGFRTDSASGAYQQAYSEFTDGTTKAVHGLEGLSSFLKKASDTLRQTDESLARGIGGQ